jgi:hypothetical protein
MKNVLRLVSIICVTLSCAGNQNKQIGQLFRGEDTIETQVEATNTYISLNRLQGIWAENADDNALFFIKADSLYYTEDQGKAIRILLKSDTLVILGDVLVHCKILKLSNDSLWFIDEFSDKPTKLYKR